MKILKAKDASVNQVPGRGFHRPAIPKIKREIVYPDSDGKPMSDNTKQFEWIVKIKENLELLFKKDPDVFIAGDLLWYPVEGNNKIRIGPDAMVVFGRPKGHRGSYRTWEENDIAPQVVFEILSPGNKRGAMERKFRFYQKYGVEEYYLYDPDRIRLNGWIRSDDRLMPISDMQGWTSPLLQIRFELAADDLIIFRPDGTRFLSTLELDQAVEFSDQRAEAERKKAEAALRGKEVERKKAETERKKADAALREKEVERKKADAAIREKETERKKAEAAIREKEVERKKAEAAICGKEVERKKAEVEHKKAEVAIREKEVERKKAESEYQRAESERREKERLAAMLRKLGVDI